MWGFPFRDLKSQAIVQQLHQAAAVASPDRIHLLMLHGELLDMTGGLAAYGEEGRQSYFPVRLAYFRGLPWHYVLAGHFHSRFDVHEIDQGRYFVYPGSPVSVSKKEMGQRQAHLLEIGRPPQAVPLDTFHYQTLAFQLTPARQHDFLERVEAAIAGAHPQAYLIVKVSGYFDHEKLGLKEAALKEALEQRVAGRGEVCFQAVDVQPFLQEGVAANFDRLLNAVEAPEAVKEQARDLFYRAMIQLNAG